MSRRRAATKRDVLPDHKYKDITLTKFMNRIMQDGKKSTSVQIVYGAFDIVSKKTDKTPIDFFHDALARVRDAGINAPIIVGGPYPTASYSEILKDKNIDLIVIAEGEITFQEILEKMLENNNKLPPKEQLANIDGIAFRKY